MSVPAYYYKVVVDLRPPGVEGIGFILPNGSANQSIGRYAVSIDSVEAFTGIDFFPVVADSVEEDLLRDWPMAKRVIDLEIEKNKRLTDLIKGTVEGQYKKSA